MRQNENVSGEKPVNYGPTKSVREKLKLFVTCKTKMIERDGGKEETNKDIEIVITHW